MADIFDKSEKELLKGPCDSCEPPTPIKKEDLPSITVDGKQIKAEIWDYPSSGTCGENGETIPYPKEPSVLT